VTEGQAGLLEGGDEREIGNEKADLPVKSGDDIVDETGMARDKIRERREFLWKQASHEFEYPFLNMIEREGVGLGTLQLEMIDGAFPEFCETIEDRDCVVRL